MRYDSLIESSSYSEHAVDDLNPDSAVDLELR
jgi:hypothetical protein